MPNPPSARAGAAWAIHSVPVRPRDGGERLDQVYRRLLGDPPTVLPHRCPAAAPALPHRLAEVTPPCAPPSTPALSNRASPGQVVSLFSAWLRDDVLPVQGCLRGQGHAAAARWFPGEDLTMSPSAVQWPQRAYRAGPDHVPAGTPSSARRAELAVSLLRRHAATAPSGSARNASPLDHIACRMTASLRATATTAFLCPFLALSISPQRLSALSLRERVSTWLAAS